MGRGGLICITVVLGIAVAGGGCGGKSNKSTSGTTSAATQAQTQSASPLTRTSPMTQRVLQNGQLAGMNVHSAPTVETDPLVWVAGENLPPAVQKAEVARLRRLGFRGAAHEDLITPTNPNRFGLSLVEQFSSRRSADAELARLPTPGPGARWALFSVPAIPGARGFEASGGGQGGRNVAFVAGPFYYLVGAGWQAGDANAVTRTQLIAGAVLLYRRVHGMP
jgi:hypothetical protein